VEANVADKVADPPDMAGYRQRSRLEGEAKLAFGVFLCAERRVHNC